MNIENEEEVVVDAEEESTEETTEETTKQEETVVEKQQETPEAKKARLERQLAQVNKKLGIQPEKIETKPSKKSDDFGYDVKAYLKTSGITDSEFDFVKKELKSSGLKDIDSLLGNGYFKANLETFRALGKTAEATPTGKRSNGVAAESTEYWAAKPFEEVPQEMRAKVVQHKLDKEKNKGQFYNS